MKATYTTYQIDIIHNQDTLEQGSHFTSMDDRVASLVRDLEFVAFDVKLTKKGGLEHIVDLGQQESYATTAVRRIIDDSLKEELKYKLLKEVK